MAAGVLVALAGLTGCSGGSEGQAGQAGQPAGDVAATGSGRDMTGPVAAKPAVAGRSEVRTRAVVRTGEVSLTAEHLASVRRSLDRLLAAAGGSVDRERSTDDRSGRPERMTLVLRVPVRRFDATREAIERLGRRMSSSSTGTDVTTEVIDVTERVQTLQNSLDRLQRFQRSAVDVGDLLRFEGQITRRQSELQSLKAQQAYLADQTSMATLTVRLSTPERYVAPPGVLDDAGFLAGLRGGWHALVGVVVVAVTVLGAALPFLVTLTLVGVPVWLLLRCRRRRRHRTPATGSP